MIHPFDISQDIAGLPALRMASLLSGSAVLLLLSKDTSLPVTDTERGVLVCVADKLTIEAYAIHKGAVQ